MVVVESSVRIADGRESVIGGDNGADFCEVAWHKDPE